MSPGFADCIADQGEELVGARTQHDIPVINTWTNQDVNVIEPPLDGSHAVRGKCHVRLAALSVEHRECGAKLY